MNAIISLCHFCELHGPKILFCTQPFHPHESTASENEDPGASGDATYQSSRRVMSPSIGSGDPQTPTGHSSLPNFKYDSCEGCTSTHFGFVSHDDDAQVSYVSSQRPHHRDVFSLIRQACIRSLSCEVSPNKEGPIFFGDEQQGHVISYTFYIEDSQARGFTRMYSILVVMMDKIYLLNSWPFLVPHLKTVVDHLKAKATVVYKEEQTRCPQRPLRLAASINPKNYIQMRGGKDNKPARSLNELTNDKNIFKTLHTSFVWILKACGNRISETLLEGPPTEDSIIDMEKQEETEEGFEMIFSKKIGGDEPEGEGVKSQDVLEEEDSGEEGPRVRDIRHLMQVLGGPRFHVLAHHTIVGNQIIVRGREKTLVKSTLNALKCLLPKGCCKVVPYSNTYEGSWRCNLLGLSPETNIPSHINSSELFLMIDVVPAANSTAGAGSSSEADELSGYEFKLNSPTMLPQKAPSVLSKMELALKNENLSSEVIDQCFLCLKEEWMNKVKVLFKFTKAGGSRSDEDTRKLLQVVGAVEEDKQLLKFWMTGLSTQYRNHILTSSMSHQGT